MGVGRLLAECLFFRRLPYVKPFPVVSFLRSLDWPGSRATR